MIFDFRENEWKWFTDEQVIDLAKNLPLTARELTIFNAGFGEEFVEAVVDCVERSTRMTHFDLRGIKSGGGEWW